MRNSWKIFLFLTLLAFSTASVMAISIGRRSSSNIWVDSNNLPAYNCDYVCYAVTNNDGVDYNSVWVKITSVDAQVTLAPGESGKVNLGPMPNGAVRYAYFYLQSSSNTETGGHDHTISIYNGAPSLNVQLGVSQTFSLAIFKSISAQANKVTSVVHGPEPPSLGGILTITADGDTGTIGNGQTFGVTAASLPTWDAGAYELFETVVYLTGAANNGNNGLVFSNLLFFSVPDTKDTHWQAVYKLRAVNTTAQPTAVSPVADINSGGSNLKYTVQATGTAAIAITQPTNGLVIVNESVSCGGSSATATNVTYTLTLSNTAPNDAFIDSFVTVLSGSPTNATYVSGSSKTNGSAYANPTITSTITNQTLVWSGYFFVPANGSRTLAFQTLIPAINGSYIATSYGTIGTNQIDTSVNLSSNNPAICSYTIAPLADVQVTKIGPTNVFAGTNFSYTLTVTNLGPSTSTNVVLIDQFPTNLIFVSAVSPGSTGVFANGQITWTNLVLTNGQGSNFTVNVKAPANATTITNIALNTATTADPATNNNNGSLTNAIVTTTVTAQTDLQVTKTGTNSVFAGTNFTYTITLTNMGPSTASSIIITDTLPVGVTFSNATAGFTLTNGLIKWPIASLTNGGVTNLTLTVIAPNDSANLTNRVSAGGIDFDPVSTNNNGTASNAIVTTTVTPQSDLKVTKSGTNLVFAGTNFSYTITLTNMGPSAASSITVTDTLPSGVTFSNATAGYTLTNGLLTWPVASLTNGGVTNFSVTVIAPANSTTLTNRASAGGIQFDPASTNNDGTATNAIVITTVASQADLQVTKTGTNNVFAGTNFSYTITLTNMGPSTASSITLTDTLPSGVTFSDATPGYTLTTNGLVTWPIASLTNGGVTNFSVTVIAPNNSATLTNRVSAGGLDFDPVSANNNGTATNAIVTTTVTPRADLQITKSGTNSVLAGSNIVYTITLTNMGPSTASSITVTDTLPSGITFVTATVGFVTNNGMVTWPIASLTNGGVTNFSVTVTAPNNSATLTNRVSTGALELDQVPGNNNGTATNAIVTTTVTPQADLQISKVGTNTVLAGSNIVYTITLTNMGPSTASSITITDTLPSGVTFVTGTLGFVTNNGMVTWPIASLTNGGVTNFSVTVTAPNHSATLTNRVSTGALELDQVPGNNNGAATNAIVTTTVTPQADLQISKVGTNTVFAGSNIVYTITLTNIGPSTASSITVTDTLPTGVTFVTATLGFVTNNGMVTWPVASLTNGGTTTFSVTVTAPNNSATLTNRVSTGALELDQVPGNNNGTATNAIVTTTVTPQADLQITKTGPTTVLAGSNIVYTITLTNMGPSTASSITVTDTLPSGVTLVTATVGFVTNNGMVTWPIANLTNGGVTNFSVTVTAPNNSATLTNRVSTGALELDQVPGNNNGTATNAIVTTTVTPQADLQITKTGASTVLAGSNLVYTITLTNMGPSTASSITVTDTLPSGVTFVTATVGFVTNNGMVTWPIASLTNGGVTNFSVTVTAPSNSATLTNRVSTGALELDQVPGNNNGTATNAIVTTTVTPQADLQITKTGPTTVLAGSNIVYTITLTNMGPSTASSVTVTDTLPSGVTFVTATLGFVTNNGMVTWPIASLTNGATTTFSVTVTAPNNSATLTNRVSTGALELDQVPGNNNGTATNAIVTTTVTPQADLQITKTGPTTVLAGSNLVYTITLTNMGPSTASSITVTDTLPSGVTFVTATLGFVTNNGMVTWPIASLTNGGVTTFSVTVTAPNNGATLTNRVSTGALELDQVPGNNDGTATNAIVITTVTPQADLQITKSGPASVFAGTNFSYTITLTNMGPSTASSITVTDTLPTGVTFVTATLGFVTNNGMVTWPIASLTNGAVTTFSVTVTAPNDSGTLTNRVSAGGTTIDLVPGNNDGTATNAIVITTVIPQADLKTTKIGPSTVYAGTNFNYTISLTNIGPSTATSVVVTDSLPAGVTFVTASGGYTFTNGLVTWPITSFASGEVTNFSITVTAPASGTLTNRALAGAPTFDPVPVNNDGMATNSIVITTIIPLADVQTTKTGPTAKGAGTNIIYTISITNAGPSTASNVVVLDTLPAGVTVISVSDGGVATTNTVTWPGLTLTSGASTNFTLTITAATGPITNIVSSTSDTLDQVPSNNDGTAPSARVITAIAVGVNVSGFVYLDANQNGFKDGAEAGTGLSLFAKIFPSTQASGPAIQAIVVNITTGGYTFSNIATGTYIIVIDDNNTLADVTPNLPSGWTGIEQPNQIRNNVIVGTTALANQNFGLVQAVTLKGTVFKDNGLTSGTANDGIKNGGEVGIAGVIVKLTDNSGATLYATANTAGDGSYTLLIPGSVTNGVPLKVVESNLNGYRSTGASVGNTAGTYERTNDVVTFTYTAGTLYTAVNFGDVPENEFTTDGQQSGLPGSTVVYSHTFTAGSVGAVTFTPVKISTPNIPGWNAVVYRDNNCNAQLDSGDTVVAGAISVAADQKICLVVKEFIPTGAPFNAQDQVTISALFAYANATPALSATATRVDLTTVGTPTTAGLSLLKAVDKANAAPGEVITYTISYVNSSSGSLSNIVIFDATPAFTTFLNATNGVMGSGLNSVDIVGPTQGTSGQIKWTFTGALLPTGSGNVIYKVTIE